MEMRHYNIEFSSIQYHRGNVPSRSDDMESLLYFLIYLINGELPWSSAIKNLKKTEL